jgi:hypothetical protein
VGGIVKAGDMLSMMLFSNMQAWCVCVIETGRSGKNLLSTRRRLFFPVRPDAPRVSPWQARIILGFQAQNAPPPLYPPFLTAHTQTGCHSTPFKWAFICLHTHPNLNRDISQKLKSTRSCTDYLLNLLIQLKPLSMLFYFCVCSIMLHNTCRFSSVCCFFCLNAAPRPTK